MSKTENISPTALITGHMWLRHGLSHPAFATPTGRWLDRGFALLTRPLGVATGVSFDDLMLARHRGIDELLTQAIESGQVTQVVEIAAGLSPRGWRICQQFGDKVHYIETDLPAMRERKRKLLDSAGLRGPHHDDRVVDGLISEGVQSLAALAEELDTSQGVAIITEGLINYLDSEQLELLWRQISRFQAHFSQAIYLSDFYLRDEIEGPLMRGFRSVLERFVRGRMHVHNANTAEADTQLERCGFKHWQMPVAASLNANRDIAAKKGANRVRILQAGLKKLT